MDETTEAAYLDHRALNFDMRNPRLPGEELLSEEAALDALVADADINELVQSIAHSGWLNYEPLIALQSDNTVLEGNRRLAALRIMADPELQDKYGIRLPAEPHERAFPAEVRVWFVPDRRSARDFIGFKHVNGPFKWDSLAKAKFAYEWLVEEADVTLDDIARRLGDGHNTVARLVNGYIVLQQGIEKGFDLDQRTKTAFAFSHLYTALPRPAVRDWLNLPDSPNELLPTSPVDDDHRDNLLQLLTWLYGQGENKSVIKSQNPNLNQLIDVLGNRVATAMLLSNGDLSPAFAQVEDRGRRFGELLFALQNSAREVSGALGDYQYDPDLQEIADSVNRTMRSIMASMNEEKAAFLDAKAAADNAR